MHLDVKRPAGDAWTQSRSRGIRPTSIWADEPVRRRGDHGSIEDQRQAYLDLCGAFAAAPIRRGVKAIERTSRPKASTCRCAFYRPAASGVLPAVMFFHGGGWVLGDLDSHDSIAADICGKTDAVVVAVHYRLAARRTSSLAAFDDCSGAALLSTSPRNRCGRFPASMPPVSPSCGTAPAANLAAAVSAGGARDRNGPALAGQVLIYLRLRQRFRPALLSRETADAPHADLTRDAMFLYWNHYMGERSTRPPATRRRSLAPHFRSLRRPSSAPPNMTPSATMAGQYVRMPPQCRRFPCSIATRAAPHPWLAARPRLPAMTPRPSSRLSAGAEAAAGKSTLIA